ncbi:hypothetical protein AB1Y20_006049 [Prymnesium parvum]|uniref:Sulfotransferase domain-containing protein n=1 Tax=Prymnesium parvum TaxID=97485 RepID=A0AB34J3I2_PRYPA
MEKQRIATLPALVGVLTVAAVSAGCVMVIARRRPSFSNSADVGAWAIRRPRPIGDAGPSTVSLPIANLALFKGHGRAHSFTHSSGIRTVNASRCLSLIKPESCGGSANMSVANCTRVVDDHKEQRQASRFCGSRVQRKNPCWRYLGREKCLPYFFILGEMKCGTTTLYKKLSQHPQVVPPRNKEVRYLQYPKFRKQTTTWYASNFDSVVQAAKDVVTFDASPTTFNAQAVAPGWISKWLPDAKLLLMLRDPVQRTYSHFRMGVSWLKASKVCFSGEKGKRAPVPSIRLLLPNVTSFAWQARASVADTTLRRCGHAGLGWAMKSKPFTTAPIEDNVKSCILASPAGDAIHGIIQAWMKASEARTETEMEILNAGEKAINHCSELMLRPGAGVLRSVKYADNLAGWLRKVPMTSFKIIATEKMETNYVETIAEVVEFLGLRPLPASSLSENKRFCVSSKEGIMDELREEAKRAGVIGQGLAGTQGGVSECDSSDEKARGADGVTRYPIDSHTMELLTTFFKPSKEKLYKLLGRDMGW